MKKIIILFAVFWMLFGSFSVAQAHFLVTDTGIGGIIHIDPDDNPIIGEKSNIFIDLKDQKNRLQEGNCECTVKILKNEQEIANYPVKIVKGQDGSLFVPSEYVFKEKAVYTIRLEGKSKTKVFDDFRLDFDFYVERGLEKTGYGSRYIWVSLCVSVVVLVGIFLTLKKRGVVRNLTNQTKQ
jgi:hypothetical protein